MKAPVFVIAEAGVNHNGEPSKAFELIHAAADAGADAVKFQTFQPSALVTRRAEKATYQKINTDNATQSQFDMLSSLMLSHEAHRELKREATRIGIEFLSTPFDEESLRFLLEIGVDRIKIGSGDLSHGSLLLAAARSHAPIILSTGMAEVPEIWTALRTISFGRRNNSGFPTDSALDEPLSNLGVTLLHCVSQYPAPLEHLNLRAITTMSDLFGLPIGFSDHSTGITASIAAVGLGACMVEKHITLDNDLPGPDHRASLEPSLFKEMVARIREVELALGTGVKQCSSAELDVREVARRSLVASRVIEPGELFSAENLTAKRPATGLPAFNPWNLYGRPASRRYAPDDLIEETI